MLFLLLGGEGQDEGELPAHGVPNTFWSGSAVQNALPKPDKTGHFRTKTGGVSDFPPNRTRNEKPGTRNLGVRPETRNQKLETVLPAQNPSKTHPFLTQNSRFSKADGENFAAQSTKLNKTE